MTVLLQNLNTNKRHLCSWNWRKQNVTLCTHWNTLLCCDHLPGAGQGNCLTQLYTHKVRHLQHATSYRNPQISISPLNNFSISLWDSLWENLARGYQRQKVFEHQVYCSGLYKQSSERWRWWWWWWKMHHVPLLYGVYMFCNKSELINYSVLSAPSKAIY